MNAKVVYKSSKVCICGGNAVIADLKTSSHTVLKPHVGAATTRASEIVCCDLSESGNRLAFTTDSKDTFVYEHDGTNWTLLRTFKLQRIGTSIKFTNQNEDTLIVADRAGDVHEYLLGKTDSTIQEASLVAQQGSNTIEASASGKETKNAENSDDDSDSETESCKDGRLLLGHYSMLTDMSITSDDSNVITADRDNKIRISHYPNTYSIRAYCLAHTAYVIWTSCVTLNDVSVLLSASGDGTLRGWDWQTGTLLGTVSCSTTDGETQISQQSDKAIQPAKEELPIKFVSLLSQPRRDSPTRALLAVTFFNMQSLQIYAVELDKRSAPKVEFSKLAELQLEAEAVSHALVDDVASDAIYCYALLQTPRNKIVRVRVDLDESVRLSLDNDDFLHRINNDFSSAVNTNSGSEQTSMFVILSKAPRPQSGASSAGVQQYLDRKQKRMVERAQKRKANQTDACS